MPAFPGVCATLIMLCLVSTGLLAEEPASFVGMTFNIRYDNPGDGPDGWKHRRDAVARLIASRKVDVVGLQEVMANQLDDLRERLPEYEFIGGGRDSGKRKGEFSPLLVRKESFKVVSSGTFWLSESPDKAGSKGWDAALPRICTWARLESRVPGRSDVLAASTHFDHRGKQARLESAKLLRAELQSLRKKEEIAGGAILMGDFNCTEQDPPYAALVEKPADGQAAWTDAYHATDVVHKGPDSTWNGFKEIVPHRRIDFVFVSGLNATRHEIVDERVAGRFLSDHLPVIVTVQ